MLRYPGISCGILRYPAASCESPTDAIPRQRHAFGSLLFVHFSPEFPEQSTFAEDLKLMLLILVKLVCSQVFMRGINHKYSARCSIASRQHS